MTRAAGAVTDSAQKRAGQWGGAQPRRGQAAAAEPAVIHAVTHTELNFIVQFKRSVPNRR